MRPTPQLPPLEVYMLGLVDFLEVQQLQRRIVYDLGERGGAAPHSVRASPHDQRGRAGSRAHIGPDDDTLRSLGIKVHWVNRGGGCVFHLPGQLTAYFALPLESFELTVGDYVERLHTAIVLCLAEFDLTGTIRRGVPGVFSGQALIATVGVAVTRWIAYHGLTLNVGPYLEMFDVLDDPGPGPAPLRYTSMEARRQRHTAMSKVREALVRRLEEVFGVERHHVYTRHPMINGKVFSHVYAPTPG